MGSEEVDGDAVGLLSRFTCSGGIDKPKLLLGAAIILFTTIGDDEDNVLKDDMKGIRGCII